MKYNNKKAIFERIIGIFCRIIGWPAFAYGSYLLVKNYFLLIKAELLFTTPVVYTIAKAVVCMIIGGIIAGNGTNRLSGVKDYKMYFPILSADPTHSIDFLVANTNMLTPNSTNNNFVKAKIINLIGKGYFPKGTYIDPGKSCVVFPYNASENAAAKSAGDIEYITVVCKGCGATNKIVKDSTGECEYCGSTFIKP